jgi:prepilin-type N-terminal cleavage/methylation domain-containing protein
MLTSTQKTSNLIKADHGFSLIEIMVALLLAALIFMAIPSGDTVQKHRELKSAVDDIDRAIRFASNESVLRNTVVRIRISLDKIPVEYTVEYGPAGNLPLPDMPEKTYLSLEEEKTRREKSAALDRQFAKVEEFEEIKHEFAETVSIAGVVSSSTKNLIKEGDASIYFYPTGEKDAALIFFATSEEIAHLEVEPFLSETKNAFFVPDPQSVARPEDILQTRMDEVYRAWLKP